VVDPLEIVVDSAASGSPGIVTRIVVVEILGIDGLHGIAVGIAGGQTL